MQRHSVLLYGIPVAADPNPKAFSKIPEGYIMFKVNGIPCGHGKRGNGMGDYVYMQKRVKKRVVDL